MDSETKEHIDTYLRCSFLSKESVKNVVKHWIKHTEKERKEFIKYIDKWKK